MMMTMTDPRRRPWLALTASLALPGLGQMYNGEIYKGIWLFALLALLAPLSAWLALQGPYCLMAPMVVLGVLAALGLYAFSVVDAFRTAASLGAAYVPRSYNHGHAYLALFLCGYFFVLGPSVQHTKASFLEVFVVPTPSMSPALLPGDQFLADKNVNRPGGTSLWRGAITVFTYPNNRVQTYVKRIIALPGDHVEITGTTVSINGKAITQPVPIPAEGGDIPMQELGDRGSYVVVWKKDAVRANLKLDVPPGTVFVMGDNRDQTRDSRKFGVVPLTDILGVARQILVSARDGAVRWGRTGQVLR